MFDQHRDELFEKVQSEEFIELVANFAAETGDYRLLVLVDVEQRRKSKSFSIQLSSPMSPTITI